MLGCADKASFATCSYRRTSGSGFLGRGVMAIPGKEECFVWDWVFQRSCSLLQCRDTGNTKASVSSAKDLKRGGVMQAFTCGGGGTASIHEDTRNEH